MDWHKLYFGRVSPDAEWQKLRKEMKGRAPAEKYDMLRRYSERLTFDYLKIDSPQERMVMLQVRCGLIEPKAYRRD